MARIDSFLRLVAEQRASDLHFCAGSLPAIRHDGDLLQLPFRTLSESEARRFLLEVLDDEQRAKFKQTKEIDFVYSLEDCARFRANYFEQSRGVGAVFRVIHNEVPTLEDLDMLPAVEHLTKFSNGLVLVTGPTGSGKSTTLAAMIRAINARSRKHIISVEDPVEFVHEPLESAITQRQVGLHAQSFAGALRSALRESPDVIVVGEMRDQETMNLAMSAAETGALVFGTLHTNSAAGAIDRIVDAMPDGTRTQVRGVLSVLLRGVVAQHLVKRATGEGRIAVTEILLQNFATSNLIREGKTHQLDAHLQTSENANDGVISLDSCLLMYLKQGLIFLDDALRIAKNPEQLRELAANIPEDQ